MRYKSDNQMSQLVLTSDPHSLVKVVSGVTGLELGGEERGLPLNVWLHKYMELIVVCVDMASVSLVRLSIKIIVLPV